VLFILSFSLKASKRGGFMWRYSLKRQIALFLRLAAKRDKTPLHGELLSEDVNITGYTKII
jgi:hypothetical protein